jgi:hypothetical protein
MQMKDTYSFKSALFVSLVYFLVGILWIYFSDSVVDIISIETTQIALLQTYKGFFYIFVATVLLYFLFLHFLRSQNKEYMQRLEILKKTDRTSKIPRKFQSNVSCTF